MADHQVIINSQIYKLIPLGFCACGCGGKTTIPKWNNKAKGWVKGRPIRFVNNHHCRQGNNPNWNGGKCHKRGYPMVCNPEHPRADLNGYVLEHILIAEKALGKALPPQAVVHHVNETKNSGPLVICQDRDYHNLLHHRMRELKRSKALPVWAGI